MNTQEDIKILQELIAGAKAYGEYEGNKYFKCMENLIARNKELEKELLSKSGIYKIDINLKEGFIPKSKVRELFDELISYNLKGNLEDSENILKIVQKYKKLLNMED